MAVATSPRPQRPPVGLEHLPDSLLLAVLTLLPSKQDVYAACLVSRRLNSVADAVLYKAIFFDQPKHHMTFSESLLKRPRRGSLIQNVRLEYPSAELMEVLHLKDNPRNMDHFSHAISTMSNLESLVISVPESLAKGIGSLFNGPFDLACLKSCELSYHLPNRAYWSLQTNIHIFSHPTLETLTIHRCALDARGFDALETPSLTPLRTLHFIDCDISDDALFSILLLPEALREISLSQQPVPSPPLEESPLDVEDYFLAFKSAAHSLETISLDFASLECENALRLREFQALKSLEIRDWQLFGESVPGKTRGGSVGMPPEIENLEFLNRVGEDEEVVELLIWMLEERERMLLARNLRRLVIGEGVQGVPGRLVEVCKESGVELEVVYLTDD